MTDKRIEECARALVKEIGYGEQVGELPDAVNAAGAVILKWLQQEPSVAFCQRLFDAIIEAAAKEGLLCLRDDLHDAGTSFARYIYKIMCTQAAKEIAE